jgi:hypothetical protein
MVAGFPFWKKLITIDTNTIPIIKGNVKIIVHSDSMLYGSYKASYKYI